MGDLKGAKEEKFELQRLKGDADAYVDEEATNGWSQLCNQILAAISVALVSVVNGFVSAYTSPITESLRDSLAIDDEQFSWIVSLVPLGALVGGLGAGPFIDLIGRKRTILMTDIMFIISWLSITSASSVWFLYVGRVIAGLAMGIMSLAIPVYLGETLQPSVRGTLGLFPTAFGNIGILLCFTAGAFLSWRNLAWFGLVFPIPFLILNFIIPETPRWFLAKNKDDSALKALQWARKSKKVTREFNTLKESAANSEQAKFNIQVCMNRSTLKPLLAGLGLMFFQQMSGISAVIYYTVHIFKLSGSSINENLCTIIVGVVNFVSVFIASVLIDKLGRKVLLYVSAATMLITLAILGGFFHITETEGSLGSIGWVPLMIFIVYVLAFSLGFGPIPWLMLGEIFPLNVRGTAGSIATAFNWACSFIVTKTFLEIVNAINASGTFWLYACMCAIAIVFIYFFVPETRNKTLEDIEKEMGKR